MLKIYNAILDIDGSKAKFDLSSIQADNEGEAAIFFEKKVKEISRIILSTKEDSKEMWIYDMKDHYIKTIKLNIE